MKMPDECPKIASRLDGRKVYCTLWERWTNCLEAGHCTYETTNEGKEGHGSDRRSEKGGRVGESE